MAKLARWRVALYSDSAHRLKKCFIHVLDLKLSEAARSMALSFSDPTDEIAREVSGESWDQPFTSLPPTASDIYLQGSGWELRAALEESMELNSTLGNDKGDQSSFSSIGISLQVPDDLEDSTLFRSKKRYKLRKPSRFCHFCGRKARNGRSAACGRVINGFCRKVVCQKCLTTYGDAQGAPIGVNVSLSTKCNICGS